MKKVLIASSLAVMLGLASGCTNNNNEKNESKQETVKKEEKVQKEEILVAKDILKKAIEQFKKEENVAMDYKVETKSKSISANVDMKIQLEPKTGNTKIDMGVLGSNMTMYNVDGKTVTVTKNPNTKKEEIIPIEGVEGQEIKTGNEMTKEFDNILKYGDQLKAEKKGSDYVLTLELNGEKATEMAKSLDPSTKTALEDQQATVDKVTVEYVIDKDYKFKELNQSSKMKLGNEDFESNTKGVVTSYEKAPKIELPKVK